MEMVKIYHPNIDDGNRVVEVPEISLPHHLRGGWLRDSERQQPEEESQFPDVEQLPEAEDLGENPNGEQPNSDDKKVEE